MQELFLKVPNETGLHARPARIFASLARSFDSVIDITANGRTVNAKSILSVLTLGAVKDTDVMIRIEGNDEEKAKDAIQELFANNLNEN